MVFGVFFSTGIEFLGVAALFLRFGSIRGWTLAQIAVFYGKISIAFALAKAYVLQTIGGRPWQRT